MNVTKDPFEIILKSKSWKSFLQNLDELGDSPEYKKIKGNAFEYLTKFYLLLEPSFAVSIDQIFHNSELPASIIDELKLPNPEIGVDLIAKYNDGNYCAIQCKFHQDRNTNVTYNELSTFFSVTQRHETYNKLSHRLICTSSNEITNRVRDIHPEKLGFLTFSDFSSFDESYFEKIHDLINGKKSSYKKLNPRPHQINAISNAFEHFRINVLSKGKIIHPCGSGKSLTAYWCAKKLNVKNILIAVPSLALVRQTLNVWSKQSLADQIKIEYIAICSDQDVSQIDDPLMNKHDIGISVTTSKKQIQKFLEKSSYGDMRVILTTYQSSEVVISAANDSGFIFDLGIFDEAHKTTGDKSRRFSLLLQDQNIHIKNKIFMTATERQFKGNSDNLISMDDDEIYGNIIDQLSFRKALEQQPPILCDYKVITVSFTKKDIEQVISNNDFVKINGKDYSFNEDGSTIAALLAHRKLSKERNIKHAISFHKNISRAKEFTQLNNLLNNQLGFVNVSGFHVSGKMGTSARNFEIEKFRESENAIISNARCLTEGVDIPIVDAVVFADSKKSLIDIVQASGRAMRTHPLKNLGYIIISVILDETGDTVNDAFKQLVDVVAALGISDERVIDEAKEVVKSKKFGSREILEFEEYSPDVEISFDKLIEDIQIKIWDRLSFAKSVVGESEFKKWMKNETELSESSRDKYSSAIRKISNDLIKMDMANSSLEEIIEKGNLENLKDKYFSIDQYNRENKRGHNMLSSSFQRLIEYQNFRNQQ